METWLEKTALVQLLSRRWAQTLVEVQDACISSWLPFPKDRMVCSRCEQVGSLWKNVPKVQLPPLIYGWAIALFDAVASSQLAVASADSIVAAVPSTLVPLTPIVGAVASVVAALQRGR